MNRARKRLHLDFHNHPTVRGIGCSLTPDDFRAAVEELGIDSAVYGNTLAEVPCYQNGAVTAVVRRVDALSVYHFWGDWPLLVLSLVALAYALSQAKRGTFIIQT